MDIVKKLLGLSKKKKVSARERYFDQVKHDNRLLEKQERELKGRISRLEQQIVSLSASKDREIEITKAKMLKTAKKVMREYKEKMDHAYRERLLKEKDPDKKYG